MAFKLNVHGSHRKAARTLSTAERIIGARQQVRWTDNVGYFESPRMHLMSAALMFLMGLSLATLRIQLNSHQAYDMTPTGSIGAKSAPASPKHTCE